MVVTVIDKSGGVFRREHQVGFLVVGKHVEVDGATWVDLRMDLKDLKTDETGQVYQKFNEQYVTLFGDVAITIRQIQP